MSDKIAKYDANEVQILRDGAKEANMDMTEEDLLGFLEFRQTCRDIKTGLDDIASGSQVDTVVDRLENLLVTANAEKNPEMADYYQEVLDSVRVGDSSDLREFHTNSCSGVQ